MDNKNNRISRRGLLLGSAGVLAAPAFLTPSLVKANSDLHRTPSQTEGPYYPDKFPAEVDFDLASVGGKSYTKAQIAWVTGQVTNAQGHAVNSAIVEIWQSDHAGRYHHAGDGNRADKDFQGFGRVTTGEDGRYRFRTILPGIYPGRTPHIHIKVKLGKKELLTTQLYIEGHPNNSKDSIWRRLNAREQAALTRSFVAKADGLHADFPIVVKAYGNSTS